MLSGLRKKMYEQNDNLNRDKNEKNQLDFRAEECNS